MLKNIREYLDGTDLDDQAEMQGALTAVLAFIAVEAKHDSRFFELADRMIVGAGHDGFRERLRKCRYKAGTGSGEDGNR